MKAGERGRGRSPGVGDGSPGSREAEGEGGEGFYIAQSGRHANLHVSREEWPKRCFQLVDLYLYIIH